MESIKDLPLIGTSSQVRKAESDEASVKVYKYTALYMLMPIIDYRKQFAANLRFLQEDEDVLKENLEHVNDYLASLEANGKSPASMSIFCSHIRRFLKHCRSNITNLFEDRNKVNNIFALIRASGISDATYYTTVTRVKTLVRWLNDGETPKGFKDLKKKIVKRALTSTDMLSEEEIDDLLQACDDCQMKAAIALLLDAGCRPSEFYDLTVGDIHKGLHFLKLRVNGKTGERTVFLHHSMPEVTAWLNVHPLKEDSKAPLWITRNTKGDVRRPTQRSIQKRIKTAFKRAKVDKPCDFYALRHNANVRKKREGVQDNIAARMAGHSVKEFSETYGRLCDQDVEDAMKKTYGIDERKDTRQPIQCSCGHLNPHYSDYCGKCAKPLSSLGKLKEEQANEEKFTELVLTILRKHSTDMLKEKIDH